MPLDAKIRMYQQMGEAARQMGGEDLKRRYGPPSPGEEAAEGEAPVVVVVKGDAEVRQEPAEGEAMPEEGELDELP